MLFHFLRVEGISAVAFFGKAMGTNRLKFKVIKMQMVFCRPFGTYANRDRYPALKRWAIVGSSLWDWRRCSGPGRPALRGGATAADQFSFNASNASNANNASNASNADSANNASNALEFFGELLDVGHEL